MNITMKNRKIYWILPLLMVGLSAFAQSNPLERARANGYEFELRAGVNIGGALPVPMPVEVRSIEGYNPRLNGLVEAVVTKWIDPKGSWGIMTGLRLEEKGMKATAMTKNYATAIESMGQVVEGRWTGKVMTNFSATYLTLPIQVAYRINEHGKVNAGFFVGYRFDGDFSGHVTDGYFRLGDPTGEKMVFSNNAKASYSFKDQLSAFESGIQLGGSWRAYKHFLVFSELKYALTGVFPSKSLMAYNNMHTLYMSLGFSYLF